jgi:sigma-B regulation protein RsbU (phosphoserine phosphatase)
MKVLVVEDEEVSALILEDTLQELGYDVELAADGTGGWDRIQEDSFSVVILDWVMPGLTGIEICRRIRERSIGKYTYVILLTGRAEKSDRAEALQAGVDDFLTKPIDPFELRARLNVAHRILKSEADLMQANVGLRNARRAEVEVGSDIQRTLLRGNPPGDDERCEVQNLWLASNLVSGDFVDFYRHGPDVIDAVIGDVMGKGIPAAMVAAGVKSSLDKSLLKHLGLHRSIPGVTDIMATVGESTISNLIDLNTFVTLCYARLNTDTGLLSYVNCGHPQIVRWIAKENRCELLPATTAPLGFLDEDRFESKNVQLGVGDLLLIYSDGISDLITPSGETLGLDGFAEWTLPRGHFPLSNILSDLTTLRDQSSSKDDFTCIAIRYLGRSDERELEYWTAAGGLSRLRDFITEHRNGLSDRELGEIILAVQEAASNAVRHARRGHLAVPIAIRLVAKEGRTRVELRYPGVCFDPTAAPDVEMDLERDGGFGLPIMRKCVDAMDYVYEHGLNILGMEKQTNVS